MDKTGDLKEDKSPCSVCGATATVIAPGGRAYCARHAARPAAPTPERDGIDKAAAKMGGE